MSDEQTITPRTYLGDGLYAEYDGYQLKLAASNGIIDTDVYGALLACAGASRARSLGRSTGATAMVNIELRDWFAGVALGHLPRLWDEEETEKTVSRAYFLADAMLAARGPAKPEATDTPEAMALTQTEREAICKALVWAARTLRLDDAQKIYALADRTGVAWRGPT